MDKLLLLFGLMRKAGRVEIGDDPVTDTLRRGEALAVCCAADASDNTIKHFQRAAEGEEIPFMHLRFDKKELGGVFGRESVAVVALTDTGFAARLFELCSEEDSRWRKTAEDLRRKADALVQEQKRRRQAEKEARTGKRPKPAPTVEAASPVSSENAAPEHPQKPAVPQKRFTEKSADRKPAYSSRERFDNRRPFRKDRDDTRQSYVSEENPTGKTYGKVYGKAPKATHVSLGDRRREDAQRQDERNGFEKHSYGNRKPFGEKKSFGDKKPFGEKKAFSDKKPFGEKKAFGDKKPFGEKKSFGDKKPFGEKKAFGDKKPFGEKSFGDKKPFGEKKSFGDKKPFGEKKAFSDKKPFGEKKAFGDKKPFGEKKAFSDKKPFGQKSDGFGKNTTTFHQGRAPRSAQHYADSSVHKRNGGKA